MSSFGITSPMFYKAISGRQWFPAARFLRDRQPLLPTLWLTITSMIWAVLFGMAIGIAAAVWRNRWPDRLGMTLAVTGISFPAFALGMLLMQIFPWIWAGYRPWGRIAGNIIFYPP